MAYLAPSAVGVGSALDRAVGELPYHDLKGPGLERLCFQLLQADGYIVRFFGKSGDAQYGIDLLVSEGRQISVYQCKNLGKDISVTDINDALAKFETQWLARERLPKPRLFVFVCPRSLKAQKARDRWAELETEFPLRTGVELALWDKDALDSKLRQLPEIVADIFSDKHAANFCALADLDDWQPDLFLSPRQFRNATYVTAPLFNPSLRRYLELEEEDRITVPPAYTTAFEEILDREPVVMLEGPAGAGKSVTGLALAERHDGGRRYVYYINARGSACTADALVKGVRRRGVRQTVFVIDDCHEKHWVVSEAVDRLSIELSRGRVQIICIARAVATAEQDRSDYSDLVAELESRKAVIQIRVTDERIAEFVAHLRPDLARISIARLDRLKALTGRDLVLLDEALATISVAADIDRIETAAFFRSALIRYFGTPIGNAPNALKLTALAQFDVSPPIAYFGEHEHVFEFRGGAALVVQIDAPPRYVFQHSSLATLIFSALARSAGCRDAASLAALITQQLISYLDWIRTRGADGVGSALTNALQLILRTRLSLHDREVDIQVKRSLLEAPKVASWIEAASNAANDFTLPSLAMLIFRIGREGKGEKFYANVLCGIIERIVTSSSSSRSIGMVNLALRELKLTDNGAPLKALEKRIGADQWLRLILANGTLSDLLKIIENSSNTMAGALISALTDGAVSTLVDKTIDVRRSIGTLGLTLRELEQSDDGALLKALEIKIGAEQWLRLILANGTLSELLKIIANSSNTMASALISALTEEAVNTLVYKTIDVRRSIGTLSLALRELEQGDDGALLRALEKKIGAEQWLRLILANGTFLDLLGIVRRSSDAMASALIAALTEENASTLINKTIDARRSIGTLSLALRELEQSNDGALLSALEKKISAEQWLRLILANGTFFELLKIISTSSDTMASALIAALTEENASTLIDKTIDACRSIGTLSLALRELEQSDDGALLRALEIKIGAEQWLRLILANGTFLDLLGIVSRSSDEMAIALIARLSEEYISALIDKTIDAGRPIGTLNLPFKTLASSRDKTLLKGLEHAVGVDHLWRLLVANGTLRVFPDLCRDVSPDMQRQLLQKMDALPEHDWTNLVLRGDFWDLVVFAIRLGGVLPDHAARTLQAVARANVAEILRRGDWYALNSGLHKLRGGHSSSLWTVLVESVHSYCATVVLDDLQSLPFREAVNALDCLWQERPSLRAGLAERLWTLLPDPKSWWQKDEESFQTIRLLFQLMIPPEIDDEAANPLIRLALSADWVNRLSEATTLDVFLHLWNTFSLWCEKTAQDPLAFRGFLSETVKASIGTILINRAKAGSSRSELKLLLVLTGLASFIGMEISLDVRKVLTANLKYPLPRVHNLTSTSFVPAFFGLYGIRTLVPNEQIFSRNLGLMLIEERKKYTTNTRALGFLEQVTQNLSGLKSFEIR